MTMMYSNIPCAILLCGSDNTVVDRHGSLNRLADWHHHLLLVLLLHHLLIFISHWYLEKCKGSREKIPFRKNYFVVLLTAVKAKNIWRNEDKSYREGLTQVLLGCHLYI